MIFAGCCLATIASLGLGAAAFTFQTPVRETCIAAGFAILPRVIWTSAWHVWLLRGIYRYEEIDDIQAYKRYIYIYVHV